MAKKRNILNFGLNLKIVNFIFVILFIFLLIGCYSKNRLQHTAHKNYNKTINKIHHDVSKHEKQRRKQEIFVFK